jgi:ABC-type transporter Mla MlaB component
MSSAARNRLLSKMAPFSCDVRALPADLTTIDVLARLQLAARRCGCELRLCHATAELRCLLELTGLEEVLALEPERQPEEREQRLRVEEEGQLRDPPA